ncbi:MAG: matrixin family metalloprotease [Acidobacteria bacterium]|nr:matrixin family metalloprotease [Acidobacteriota bacterium]
MSRVIGRLWLYGMLMTAVLAAAAPARASIRIVPDAVLAAQSVAAVHGRVVQLDARWDPAVDAIYTYVTIEVWRAFGRTDLPSRIVIKQLGGHIGEADLRVGGQASFGLDEEVFLFLEVRPRDHTLYVAGLEQGKWSVADFTADGGRAARRDAHVALFQQAIEPVRRSLADLESLAAHSGGTTRSGIVAVPTELSQPRVAAPAWAYLSPNTPARWHEAETGESVFVDFQSGGHPQLAGGGLTQLTRAIAMWRNASSLDAQPGAARGPRCFTNSENDGRLSVTYGDPCGEIADASSTLAIGGFYWGGTSTQVVSGVTFRKITKGMVVVDNAADKFQNMSLGCYEQMLAHELGHAIGFGHSAVSSAIMSPTIGGCSGRTTSNPLSADDLSGLAVIYPTGNQPPTPPTTPTVPAAPQNLSLSASLAGLLATWQPLAESVIEYIVEVGSTPGASNLATLSAGLQTSFSAPAPAGRYYVRIRARNSAGIGPASLERSITVASAPTPMAPSALVAAVRGNTVTLQWLASPGPPPLGYVVQAGSAPGLSDLANVAVSGLAFAASGVQAGTYYVRVRAHGSAGLSAASNEVQVVVTPVPLPGAPGNLRAIVAAGGGVTVEWEAPTAGAAPTGYLLEAGSAPGLANLARLQLSSTTFATAGVAPGQYHLRVRAINTSGSGPASSDIVVTVF